MSESLLLPSQTLAIDPQTTTVPSLASNSNTATATVLQNIPPALFFIVPAFSVALLVLAIGHRSQYGSSHSPSRRVQARIAYAFVAALGVLSTIAGAIPLSMAGINSDLRSEKVVEAFVSLLLGVPVLHLASTRPRSNILHFLHTGALALTLSGATLLALLIQFLSTPGAAYIPPALFLVFSVLALPRLAQALLLHSPARHLDSNSSVHFLTPSPSKPSWFFRSGIPLNPKSGSKRKPITIHVATHRTSYPLSLPSPSSSNSFPLTESVSSYELELGRHSLRHHNYNQQAGGEIELDISLPCRDSGFERKRDRNSQGYSYHDLHVEYPPERIGPHSEEKHHQLGRRRREDKHKVELNRSSVDSSTSTLTTNTDRKLERASSFNRVLTPPLTRIRLPTIASARSSDVELQYSNSTPNQGITSVPNSIRFGNLFTGNTDNRSTRTGRTSSLQVRTGEPHHGGLLNQLKFTRTRCCFAFLIAAQVTALGAYACAVGVEVAFGGYQSGVIARGPPGTPPRGFKEPNWGTLTLRIVQAACTVLAVTGTMSAYFLHAYNEYTPPSTGPIDDHAPNRTNTTTTTTAIISGGVRPPKPAGSRPKPHSRFPVAILTDITPGVTAFAESTVAAPREVESSDIFANSTDKGHSNESENDVHMVSSDAQVVPSNPLNGMDGYEGVQGGGNAVDMPEVVEPATYTPNNRIPPVPVLIEPLSPTRKRTDTMTGGGHQKSSIPMPLMGPSPATGAVIDLTGDADALALAGSGLGSLPPLPLPQKERGLSIGYSYGPSGSATGQPFIHLTYVPPKRAEDNSLFETDTEMEADARSEDLEFETEMEDEFQEEEGRAGLDEEQETGMGTTIPSCSKSNVSGGRGTRPVRGRTFHRASVGVVAVDLHRRKSGGGYIVNHSTGKKPESTSHSSGSSRPRTKLKPSDDPNVYIRRRGSIPAKKIFGWEFGWDAEKKVGGDGTEKAGTGLGLKYSMTRETVDSVQEQESSFIDLRGDYGFGRGIGKEERKAVGGGGAVKVEKSQIERGPRRKLKKISKSSFRPTTEESACAPPSPHPNPTSSTRPLSVALAAADPIGTPITTQSKSGGFGLGRLGHHASGSSSSSRPGTGDSQASKVSYGGATGRDIIKRGFQLKKNFKLGVGRTLGPNLTLSVGTPSKVAVEPTRKVNQRRPSIVAESIPEGVDDEEIQSIVAAKLVSASIARATPASTILATPTSGGDLPAKERPVLAAIITSLPSSPGNADVPPYPSSAPAFSCSPHAPLPASSSAMFWSGKTPTPTPNKWKPHPFSEMAGNKATRNHTGEAANDVEDDVVQLEHEMEAIRGRRSESEKESPRKFHIAGGILPKRFTLSSPPAPKSEWDDQPSSAPSTAGGFRFPMIFGNDPPSSMYQHTQRSSSPVRLQTSSTPSTPRGQSTIKLSAVRNAFAGVGARMSSRMSNVPSMTRGGPGSTFSEMFMENSDGDFMDLRDPFASPPAAAVVVTPTKKTPKKGARAKKGDNFLIIDAYGPDDMECGDGKRRMSAWGKLPMPTRPFSPAANPGAKRNTNGSIHSGRSGAKVAVGHRKQKKERRARLPSMASALGAMKAVASRVGEEDADFGIEEALLSQRLLKRLDADGWESHA